MKKKSASLFLILTCLNLSAFASDGVFFKEPKNGDIVAKTFHVKMGVEGRMVCPAGKETADKTCGHHHILIDQKPIAAGGVIPSDVNHIHFGKGQTETDVTLTPGKHTLTLQFADFAHRSYGESLSKTIEVTVK
jgi:hypothetical protein